MKYCRKCFRNVREDVNVCPYCGAPGLTEYGSQNSGEDFACSQPKALEREIAENIKELQPKEDDAYSGDEYDNEDSVFGMFDEDKDDPYERAADPYGNIESDSACSEPKYDAYGSRRHSDDNCGNAPDTPIKANSGAVPDPNDPKIKMRIEYLNMLRKVNGITPARIEELMRRYDEAHGNYSGNSAVFKTSYTDIGSGQGANTDNRTEAVYAAAMIFAAVAGFLSPVFSIVVIAAVKKMFKNADIPNKKKWDSIAYVFLAIFFAMYFFVFIFAGFSAFMSSIF